MIYCIELVQKVTRAHLQIPLLVEFGRVAMLPRQGHDFINTQEPEDFYSDSYTDSLSNPLINQLFPLALHFLT